MVWKKVGMCQHGECQLSFASLTGMRYIAALEKNSIARSVYSWKQECSLFLRAWVLFLVI